MKALFLFNDWAMDLTGYSLIICAHNYDPTALRARPDIDPYAKLAAYVCWETLQAVPWGPADYPAATVDQRIYNLLCKDAFLIAGSGEGFVAGARPGLFFSSYPWPKAGANPRADRWDYALTFDRARAQAEAFSHELAVGWDAIYVDQCRPMPAHLFNRYRDAGIYREHDRMAVTLRSEHLLRFFLEYVRAMRDDPIIGNTGGWVCDQLDGICIERGHQQPWNDRGLSQVQVLAAFSRQRDLQARNERGVWSVDFAGRLDVPGLVVPGYLAKELKASAGARPDSAGKGDGS